MKKLTIKDVARAAGVSTTVVSKVINAPRRPDGTLDCPDTSRETAERVLKVVNELNYRPSRFAAGLRRGKRYVLGVITPDISNTAFSEGCRVIEDLAHRDGYTVMFGSSAENSQKMAELLDTFVANGVDGLIV
ncbi:MAG: LacI family transcriptional regulator, partial [Bacteroidales bacterium]|nr:LacI family transcriptional regulator [Bacteroidales bacterium]